MTLDDGQIVSDVRRANREIGDPGNREIGGPDFPPQS
jgi:hypothetical protein